MKCYICDWSGHPDDLVAIIDEPETINDFVYCPICKSNIWAESLDGDSNFSEKDNYGTFALHKGLDHISLVSNNKSIPKLLIAVYGDISYRMKMMNLHNSSHMIIAHPSIIKIICNYWQCHPDGIDIELVPSISMVNQAYVLTTWINTDRVLIFPKYIKEFIPLMQDHFDGKLTPIVVKAPWAQAIVKKVQ